MSKSIKVNILRVDIPNVRPYGWHPRMREGVATVQGHEFDFEVELEFRSAFTVGFGAKLDFDETKLGWHERIRWYTPDPYPPTGTNPIWKFQRQDVVDFASSKYRDSVKTVKGGWFGGGFEPGWWEPWNGRRWRDAIEQLQNGTNPIAGYTALDSVKEKKFAVAEYFKNQNRTLKTIMTDRPGLTKIASADDGQWAQTGGGGMSTINRASRRRVVHFRLSVGSKEATATQILETVAGIPTINKFVIPGLTIKESEDPVLLAKYRTQLDTANVDHFTTAK